MRNNMIPRFFLNKYLVRDGNLWFIVRRGGAGLLSYSSIDRKIALRTVRTLCTAAYYAL